MVDRRVEHQPDDVTLVFLVFAHQQHAAPRRRLPGNAPKRIAAVVFAQLAQLAALAAQAPGPPVVGLLAAASAARRTDHDRYGAGITSTP